MAIQDYSGQIYAVGINSENKINTFYHTSDNFFMFSVSNLVISADFYAFKIISESVDDTLSSLLDRDQYTALKIMRATGLGKKLYLKY